MTATDVREPGRDQSTRALVAGWIGTTVEYYDFSIYGLASSVVFAKLFFPTSDPVTGTLLSLSTFAIGFLARPVGAVVFGHFGDRLGRKSTLVATLGLMGIATFAVGLLPTYRQVGIAAPVLLIVARLAQGFSVGGEYGGAVLMTIEHGAREKRGFRGSLINTGTSAGLLLANLVFLGVLQLPDDQLHSWGWRVPFLLSAVLVGVGLFVRLGLEESPEFEAVKARNAVDRLPVVEVFRECGGRVVLMAAAILSAGVAFTLATVYSLEYARTGLHLDKDAMIAVLLPATLVIIVCVPLAGKLADRFGNRRVFIAGAASLIVLPFVWLALLQTRSYGLMLLGFTLLFIGYSANYGVVPAYFSQVFPARLRFTGMSIGFTVGLIAGNAFSPDIATYLLHTTGGWVGIAVYMAAMSAVSVVAGLFLREADDTEESPRLPAPQVADSDTAQVG
ncbi:MFS transporter [Streptomyces rapamycinicus]|uniref:MFS family permease n=3 Tax=Streptomyces rapamycinicus TaxID=1226757 RepID=A0ABR6LF23_9ACTN|nr:MFS transporter [Streptomyces rapamycinicus]AGP53453.1 transporter [Streptomyces rapamycinicus NRRL 5491]MBB4780937.1 MFS family permease [Streptomyces rapamycinicus]RLV74417.1 transporter [Streptomyces rapamycinicus NRRL 5491]UTO61613.1 MHS family MFS transporter [Streptomyces rapamycinicus]UTP29562.1 MHS family MFS transporter [Streptomyces rapamycinicus NRRL 5491]